VAAVALFLITAISPPALIGHLVVFALAIVIGYYVIGQRAPRAAHPLMSVTNAISGHHPSSARCCRSGSTRWRSPSSPPWRSCWPPSTSSAVSP
jgi:hypothetical protein